MDKPAVTPDTSAEYFYNQQLIAYGYNVDFSPLKTPILEYFEKLIADGKMTELATSFIISRLDLSNWSHPVGILYSKKCKGQPGETATDEELVNKFQSETYYCHSHGPRDGYLDVLYFTYSEKKEELTYISTHFYIGGKPYFAVLFSTNNGATSVIKKEIARGNPRHESFHFGKKVIINCAPYLYITGEGAKNRAVYSMQEYRDVKKLATPPKKDKSDKKKAYAESDFN